MSHNLYNDRYESISSLIITTLVPSAKNPALVPPSFLEQIEFQGATRLTKVCLSNRFDVWTFLYIVVTMRTQPSKRATVYLDPDLHKALKLKSVQSDLTISELVNNAVRESLAEDHDDLAAFDERQSEPNLNFEEVLKELKASGKL